MFVYKNLKDYFYVWQLQKIINIFGAIIIIFDEIIKV